MCGSLLNLLRESSPDTDLLKTKHDQKQQQQQVKSDIPIIPITHHLQYNISVLTTNTGLAFNGQ